MKNNFLPEGLIDREMYISKIQPFIGKSLIKVLTGQRRVGKSYVLFQLIRFIQKQEPDCRVIYINKEDMSFDAIRTAEDLNSYVLSQLDAKAMNYVFIDEIQEVSEFEKALRSLLLKENIDLYCSGSNADLLSGELATMLSGRYVEIQIHSLSYKEFLLFHKLESSPSSLDKFLRYGGLPYLVHLSMQDDVVFEYLRNISMTIVYRDVVARYRLRNTRLLDRLILFLADNTGSLFSAKSISDFLKSQRIRLAPNQIMAYTGYLANAFLIQRVERYDIAGKRIFEVGEKYYFENPGIRNALIGYKPRDIGKILENVVFNHLLINGYTVRVGIMNATEIDFVATKKNETSYFQVAYLLSDERVVEREFGNLARVRDHYSKYVISMDEISVPTSYEGIRHLRLVDFLSAGQKVFR